jgi:hypothetical protein
MRDGSRNQQLVMTDLLRLIGATADVACLFIED